MAATLRLPKGSVQAHSDPIKTVQPTKNRALSDASTAVANSPNSTRGRLLSGKSGRSCSGAAYNDVWLDGDVECGSPKQDNAETIEDLKLNGFEASSLDGGLEDWFQKHLQEPHLDLGDARLKAKMMSHGYCQVMPFPHLGHARKETSNRRLFGPSRLDLKAAAKADRHRNFKENSHWRTEYARILPGEDFDNDVQLWKSVTLKGSPEKTNEEERRRRSSDKWQTILAMGAGMRALEREKKERQTGRQRARDSKSSGGDADFMGFSLPTESSLNVLIHKAARMTLEAHLQERTMPRTNRLGLVNVKLKSNKNNGKGKGKYKR